MNSLFIRAEKSGDEAAIRFVNQQAFGRDEEANLVDALRSHNKVVLSLVAIIDEQIVGHILFSPVAVATEQQHAAVALGPMAVLPGFQRQGIGSELVRSSLESLRNQDHDGVVVLGHHEFYPRFGFVRASSFGISCPFEVPDEAFMFAELTPGAWAGKSGVVVYPPEFNDV